MIGKYKIAALCISRIYDDANHEVVSELNMNIVDKGYRLFVFHTCSDLYWDTASEKGQASVFDLIDMRVIDVLIICDELIKNKNVIRKLTEKAAIFDVPVIMIGEGHKNVINISFDYETGFEDVVRHMVEYHGFRRLHFMAGVQGNDFSEQRINVFERVLAENGITFDRNTMLSYGDFWQVPTAAATEKLLERDELPEAIICANDSMAITVCSVLMNAGIRVPEEIAVTGFDGILDINFSSPRITSSLCCYGDITRKIAGLLTFGKEELLREANYRIKSRLIISESCGCKGGGSINASKHLIDLNGRFYRYKEEERNLNEMGVRILLADNLKAAANELHTPIIYNMCCMLRKEVIDETINPFEKDSDHGFGEQMCVFFNTDAPYPFAPHDFPTKGLMPGLDQVLEDGYPVIFTALSFLDVPLGYVTFTFRNFDISNYEKITQVVNALNNSIGGYRNIRYQRYMTRRVQELSQFDQLTGLFTRGGAMKSYDELSKKLREQGKPITVVMADLDGLKYINDNFGHNEGDYAIKATAAALKNSCPENAVCIRMGGDEMAAFMSASMPTDELEAEINARLRSVNRTSGKPYPIMASIGIYRSPDGEIPSFEDLIRSADEMMYEVKAEHRRQREERMKAGEKM